MTTATPAGTRPPAPDAADSHDRIRVHGARVNNLKDVSVELPKRRLTAITGVSGSGQELSGVRHDRRGVAAADQRDLRRAAGQRHADRAGLKPSVRTPSGVLEVRGAYVST
jgi:ABC-type glutathione transport system ATPase component